MITAPFIQSDHLFKAVCDMTTLKITHPKHLLIDTVARNVIIINDVIDKCMLWDKRMRKYM